MEYLLDFAATDRQRQALEAYIELGSLQKAADHIGISKGRLGRIIQEIKKRAAKQGIAPENEFTRKTAPGFEAKRVSTARKITFEDGSEGYQWLIQEPEKKSLEELVEGIRASFTADIMPCKPIPAPEVLAADLAAFLIVGDHHFGMYAWSEETGSDDYDTEISERLLIQAVQKLVARCPDAEIGYLVNLGDFLHANDTTSQTPASKNQLDTDGRMGRVGRKAGLLIKTLIELMLQKFKKVIVINSRGNHDPDASMWLNEVCRAYFLLEPRVEILDNFNKFVWVKYGNNLVVTHHGDKIKWTQMYEAITRNLSKEWGECQHRFGWTGHLHHEESNEIGGMKFQRWGVLAPPDAWHAGSGYGASRTMSCVILHKEHGRDSIIEVNVSELNK